MTSYVSRTSTVTVCIPISLNCRFNIPEERIYWALPGEEEEIRVVTLFNSSSTSEILDCKSIDICVPAFREIISRSVISILGASLIGLISIKTVCSEHSWSVSQALTVIVDCPLESSDLVSNPNTFPMSSVLISSGLEFPMTEKVSSEESEYCPNESVSEMNGNSLSVPSESAPCSSII